jgi:hypothetical protein
MNYIRDSKYRPRSGAHHGYSTLVQVKEADPVPIVLLRRDRVFLNRQHQVPDTSLPIRHVFGAYLLVKAISQYALAEKHAQAAQQAVNARPSRVFDSVLAPSHYAFPSLPSQGHGRAFVAGCQAEKCGSGLRKHGHPVPIDLNLTNYGASDSTAMLCRRSLGKGKGTGPHGGVAVDLADGVFEPTWVMPRIA